MTYDPGRLAHKLETLSLEFSTWSAAAQAIIPDADHEQRHGEEQLAQAAHRAQLAAHQLAEDQDAMKKMVQELKRVVEDGQDMYQQVKKLQVLAQQTMDQASATLNYWQVELQKAQAWLERAINRLEAAQLALRTVQVRLSEAVKELQYAERALIACKNSDSRSCQREESQVRYAQSQVSAARREVETAQEEVRQAKLEVARARARASACTTAVDFAKKAVQAAEQSLKIAQQCCDAIERGLEYIEAAGKAAQEAHRSLEQEEDSVQALQASVKSAGESINQAKRELGLGEHHQQSALNSARGSRDMLDTSAEQLRRLDRPHPYRELLEKTVVVSKEVAAAVGMLWWINSSGPVPTSPVLTQHHLTPQSVVENTRPQHTVDIINSMGEKQLEHDEHLYDVWDTLQKQNEIFDHINPPQGGKLSPHHHEGRE